MGDRMSHYRDNQQKDRGVFVYTSTRNEHMLRSASYINLPAGHSLPQYIELGALGKSYSIHQWTW